MSARRCRLELAHRLPESWASTVESAVHGSHASGWGRRSTFASLLLLLFLAALLRSGLIPWLVGVIGNLILDELGLPVELSLHPGEQILVPQGSSQNNR